MPPTTTKRGRQAGGKMENLVTPSDITNAMGLTFQEAQVSLAVHKKQLAVLRAVHNRAFELGMNEIFNTSFCRLVTKILTLKKGDGSGDRITRFISTFVNAIDSEIEDEEEEDEENIDEPENEKNLMFKAFLDRLARHLMRGFEAQNKNVRYRVCNLLSNIMNNLGSIEEDLHDSLSNGILARLSDKEPIVRVQAVIALASFQNDDDPDDQESSMSEAAASLLPSLKSDPSTDVRKAVLQYIEKNRFTKPYIFERARDVSGSIRKYVFTHTLPSLGDFRTIEFEKREKLLLGGFRDRDEHVREAAHNWVCKIWMKDVKGDVLELIERLKPMDSEIADSVLKVFLANRKDVVDKIHFNKEAWESLTAESAFLLRGYYEYCSENNLLTKLDSFPEAAALADLFSKLFVERKANLELENNRIIVSESEQDTKDPRELNFILSELLKIAVNYDFSDDFGRRRMLNVLRTSLSNDSLPDEIVEVTLKVILKLSVNERDFSRMISEMVDELKDNAIETYNIANGKASRIENENEDSDSDSDSDAEKGDNDSDDSDNEDGFTSAASTTYLGINDADKSKKSDDEDDDEEFHSAIDANTSEAIANASRILEKANKSMNEERDTILSVPSQDIKQCLIITRRMLQIIFDPLVDNFTLISVIENLVRPCLRRPEEDIKVLATECLGLFCLLDEALAKDNLFVFGLCVSKSDNEKLQKIGITVITDILAVFGPSVLSTESENHVDVISVLNMFTRALKDKSNKELQAVAAESVYKLFLTGSLADNSLLDITLRVYFDPDTESNEALKQCLSFCIPVYAFSHVSHQESIVYVAASLLQGILSRRLKIDAEHTHEVKKLTNGEFSKIVDQLVFWSDPKRIANRDLSEAAKSSVQIILALQFLEFIKRTPDFDGENDSLDVLKPFLKVIISHLNKLYFTEEADFQTLEVLKHSVDYIQEFRESDDLDQLAKRYQEFNPSKEGEEPTEEEVSDFKSRVDFIFSETATGNSFVKFQKEVNEVYNKAKEVLERNERERREELGLDEDEIDHSMMSVHDTQENKTINDSLLEIIGDNSVIAEESNRLFGDDDIVVKKEKDDDDISKDNNVLESSPTKPSSREPIASSSFYEDYDSPEVKSNKKSKTSNANTTIPSSPQHDLRSYVRHSTRSSAAATPRKQ